MSQDQTKLYAKKFVMNIFMSSVKIRKLALFRMQKLFSVYVKEIKPQTNCKNIVIHIPDFSSRSLSLVISYLWWRPSHLTYKTSLRRSPPTPQHHAVGRHQAVLRHLVPTSTQHDGYVTLPLLSIVLDQWIIHESVPGCFLEVLFIALVQEQQHLFLHLFYFFCCLFGLLWHWGSGNVYKRNYGCFELTSWVFQ